MAADLLQLVHSEALMVHTWERKRGILQDHFLDFKMAASSKRLQHCEESSYLVDKSMPRCSVTSPSKSSAKEWCDF